MITFDNTSDAPATVKRLLNEAVKQAVSDIYLLPGKENVQITWRLNGNQEPVADLPKELGEQCLAHLKVLGGLLTYRTAIAQDGVIRWGEPTVEMRLASMPTHRGERLTIRMMNTENTPETIDRLGFQPHVTQSILRMLQRPNGMIVLTGPTGCGKSTTIYAMIRELIRTHQDPSSIITLEDPIERLIDGISQVSVQSEDDTWNYETALKAALRQDVKTLVVGEMRDRHIIKVVLDAALTGHRVITTYHAGDIASVYARLLHQGFEPFLIAAAISGVVTQRLVTDPGYGIRPIGAALEPDDDWRELICTTPHLGQLRDALQTRQGADIRSEANSLLEQGHLTKEQAAVIAAT